MSNLCKKGQNFQKPFFSNWGTGTGVIYMSLAFHSHVNVKTGRNKRTFMLFAQSLIFHLIFTSYMTIKGTSHIDYTILKNLK